MHLSCYVGLMCSSCSCSKYRHRLPAPMDCMVWDDHSIHLCSPAEYGIEGSRPFHLDFTSVLRRRWSASSSRFKFQQAGNWGAVWFLSTLHTFFFVFITCIAIIFTFEGFVDLSSEVLCVYRSPFILSAFLSCSFRLKSKYVSFVLLQPVRLHVFAYSWAASVATFHERLPQDLQRVSLEWVWWVNFGSTSFFCNQFKSSDTCFTRLS